MSGRDTELWTYKAGLEALWDELERRGMSESEIQALITAHVTKVLGPTFGALLEVER